MFLSFTSFGTHTRLNLDYPGSAKALGLSDQRSDDQMPDHVVHVGVDRRRTDF
jgi:hypothetical protein